jgi:choline dehydrogenase-like flavoprotein
MIKQCKKSNVCPSGCPARAKQTMSETFIPEGLALGGEILSGWKAIKIETTKNSVEVLLVNLDGLTMNLQAKNVVVSCGAIESRRLLSNSKLLTKKIGSIGFHANLKIVARFDQEIQAQKGTIFTHQLQEYLKQGFLLMPANFNELYLAYGSSALNPVQYASILSNLNYHAMFTAQYKVKGRILDIPIGFNRYFLICYFTKEDRNLIRKYLKKSAELLFLAGATEMYLPYTGGKVVRNLEEANNVISTTAFHKIVVSTVHLMSSIPIVPESSEITTEGFLRKNSKIRVLDASILPTTIGESPQGTIMAITKFLLGLSQR